MLEMNLINFDILTGCNVVLMPFTVADIDDAYIGWLNDRDVVRFSNQRFVLHSRESCMRYHRSFESTDNLFLSIRHLSNGHPIGTLTAYISRHHGTADVGIMIGEKDVWGRGFGQDAWDTITQWLLSQGYIRKLTAGTLARNRGMIKLMERSGMRLEAVRKAQECIDGVPEDVLHYAKFRDA
jgi:ribosomal-protein-alanine N-acetyltransferase